MSIKSECATCPIQACGGPSPAHSTIPHRLIAVCRGEARDLDSENVRLCWIVLSGVIALSTILEDGRRQIIDFYRSGDLIPVSGLDCRLEATTDCRLCEVDLLEAAKTNKAWGQVSNAVREQTVRSMARHLQHVTVLGRFDGLERICFFIADMAATNGLSPQADGETNVRISLPMSREDIADYLGLNAETVSRLFSRLRKLGLIVTLSPSELVVPSVDALRRRIPAAFEANGALAEPGGVWP